MRTYPDKKPRPIAEVELPLVATHKVDPATGDLLLPKVPVHHADVAHVAPDVSAEGDWYEP